MKKGILLFGIVVMLLLVPSISSLERIEVKDTNIWNEFSDWFFNLFGVEPDLQLKEIKQGNSPTQTYKLKDEGTNTISHEIIKLTKEARYNNLKFRVYEEKTCEQLIIDEHEDKVNITKPTSYNNTKAIQYDCSGYKEYEIEELQNYRNNNPGFIDIEFIMDWTPIEEWETIPEEMCEPIGDTGLKECKQVVDLVISYNGRKYIEYAQWEQGAVIGWNGELSNTVINATGIINLDSSVVFTEDLLNSSTSISIGDHCREKVCGTCFTSLKNGNITKVELQIRGNGAFDTSAAISHSAWIYTTDTGGQNPTNIMSESANVSHSVIGAGYAPFNHTWTNQINVTIGEVFCVVVADEDTVGCGVNCVEAGLGTNVGEEGGYLGKSGGAAYPPLVSNPTPDNNRVIIANIYIEEELTIDFTEGNITSVGFGNGTDNFNFNEISWLGFNNVEYRSSEDNTTWNNWANATNGVDLEVNNVKFLQVRGQCINSVCFGEYINVSFNNLKVPNDATDLKINASTDNNLSTDDIFGEFRVGSDEDNPDVVYNLSWYKDGILNLTFGNMTNTTAITLESLTSGNTTTLDQWAFSVTTCDIPDHLCSSEVFSSNITIISQAPTVPNINFPDNNTQSGNSSIELSCNGSTDPDGDTIFYQIFADTNNPPTTLVSNTTIGLHNFTTEGDTFWRCRAADNFGTLSAFNETRFFQLNSVRIINATLNHTELAYSTGRYNYNTTVTINKFSISDINANLTYNGTVFTPTKTLLSDQDELQVYLFDVDVGTESFGEFTANGAWNFTLSMVEGTTELNNSFTFTNEVAKIEFNICNETLNTPFINFTFRDEQTDTLTNGSFIQSTFNYTLDLTGEIQRTLLFSNRTDQDSFAFCFDPINQTILSSINIDYTNDLSQQRSFTNISILLTNNTFNQELLLLDSSTGLFVTFQVINPAEQPLSDVSVQARRIINGVDTLIASGLTDDAGAVTFFLNPNFLHTMIFVKAGFETVTKSITPSSTTFTVTMGSVATQVEDNFFRGITTSVEPRQDILSNDTSYNFNFTINSSFWALSSSGFTLFNGDGLILGLDSCLEITGCFAQTTVTTTTNSSAIIMNYWWIIEGNTSNLSKTWLVKSTGGGSVASMSLFLIDMKQLGKAFGEGSNAIFTRALIAFFIMLFIVGVITFISGVFSPLAIIGEVFFLTLFFTSIGFIPPIPIESTTETAKWFITVVIGLLGIGYILTEFKR